MDLPFEFEDDEGSEGGEDLTILGDREAEEEDLVENEGDDSTMRSIGLLEEDENGDISQLSLGLTSSPTTGRPGRNREKPMISDFEVIRMLGTGSFGKVVLVRSLFDEEEKLYAMKIISKKRIKKKKRHQDYIRAERDILARLPYYRFVTSLLFAFRTQNSLCLVMEYIEGGELFYLIRRHGAISERAAKIYVAEIVLALAFLHKNGVIHRDLKPENVLLREDGHVCLTDFGLAKDLGFGLDEEEEEEEDEEETGRTRTLCGTDEYMAPEMILRENYGKAVDYWALGCLLFEMVIGKAPFRHRNRKKLHRLILESRISLPPYLEASSHSILKQLLCRDPSRRLGATKSTMLRVGGIQELKRHPFFRGLDWLRLEAGEVSFLFFLSYSLFHPLLFV